MRGNIRILGAGISGLVTANLLADAGVQVHLYEKRSSVGSFHGQRSIAMLRRNPYPDCDTLEEFRKLGIPYRLDREIRQEIRISRHYQVMLRDRTILFAVIRGQDEQSLEHFLLQQALSKGMSISYNTALRPEEVDVIASGGPEQNVHGYGQTLKGGTFDLDSVYTIYDHRYVPNGYFCVMPSSGGDATFLAVSFDPFLNEPELRERYGQVLSRHPVIRELARDRVVVAESSGGGFYARDPYALCLADGRIRVGEAAGFLEAARGFGLRYAMITGALAARALLSGSSYLSLVRDYFGDEFERNWQRRQQFTALRDKDYDGMVKELGGQPI